MGYVGNQTTTAFTSMAKQDITGNGGTGYTLDHAVANAQEIEVFVNNVRQEPGTAYTVSGTTLTMTGNVASSDDFYVVYQGKAVQTVVPPDGTVSAAKLETNIIIPGHVLQVVQKVDTAVSTITNTGTAGTFVTCGSLSQSFTPRSSSSKVLLKASVFIASTAADRLAFFKFGGGNAASGVGAAAGSRSRALAVHYFQNAADATQVSFEYLDSPATSSAITYTVQIAPNFTNGNIYVNRYSNDTDAAYIPRAASTLTIMEIGQ